MSDHHILLRCFPQNTARQRVEALELSIEPATELSYDEDHFGNRTGSCLIAKPHSGLGVSVRGLARTGLDIFEATEPDEMKACVFRYASTYTGAGEALQAYRRSLRLDERIGPYDKALAVMRSVAGDMTYERDVTDIRTTAEEALSKGRGVCQDYAHIMLALLRMERVPCRYAVGLMRGEGVSHAWVEALCKGYWYGFDPTNNLLVDDNYIKFSHGRDYEDCVVNKGFFTGATSQRQSVEAVVTEQ